MSRAVTIVLLFALWVPVQSQSDFVFTEDFSQIKHRDVVAESAIYSDTIYTMINTTIAHPDDSLATLNCNALLVMDNLGGEIARRYYPSITTGIEFDQMIVEEDRILITHGEYGDNPLQYISQIDRQSLDIDTVFSYESGLDIQYTFSTAFKQYRDSYILGISNKYADGHPHDNDWVGYYHILDATTMIIDTTLYLPFEVISGYVYDIYEQDGDPVLYYVMKSSETLGHGFIRLDSTFTLIDRYEDDFNIGHNLNRWHQTGKLTNGDFIYSHLWSGESQVISVSKEFNVNWEIELPFPQYMTLTGGDLVICSNEDILITGSVDVNFEFSGYDWIDIEVNHSKGVPYIAKLDGDTGELLWHYIYIGLDDFGSVKYFSATDIVETESGDLYFSGSGERRFDEPRHSDMHIIKIPADGCIVPQTDCQFYQFVDEVLTSIVDTEVDLNNPYSVLINQQSEGIEILLSEDWPSNTSIMLSHLSGTVITNQIYVSKYTNILTSGLDSGLYFVTVFSADGSHVTTKKCFIRP